VALTAARVVTVRPLLLVQDSQKLANARQDTWDRLKIVDRLARFPLCDHRAPAHWPDRRCGGLL